MDSAPVCEPGAAFSVSTPIELAPPRTLDGLSVIPVISKGLRTIVVVLATPPKVAVTVTVWVVATCKCRTINDALVAPFATFTLEGTTSEGLELFSTTESPAFPAVASTETDPDTTELEPLTTSPWDRATLDTDAA